MATSFTAAIDQARKRLDGFLSRENVLKGLAYGEADKIAEAAKHFASAVSLLPGGAAELDRRRLLIAEQTETGTPFHSALRGVLPCLRSVPANANVTSFEAVGTLRTALWQWAWTDNEGRSPECTDDVRRVYQAGQHLVSASGLPSEMQLRFEVLRDTAYEVLEIAERHCVDGVAWMTDDDLPEYLRIAAMAVAILPAIKVTVESLVSWAAESEARSGKHIPSPTDGEGESPDHGNASTGQKLMPPETVSDPPNRSQETIMVVMTAAAAGRHIGASSKTVRNWIRNGILQAEHQDGYQYRFSVAELDAKRESHRKRRG